MMTMKGNLLRGLTKLLVTNPRALTREDLLVLEKTLETHLEKTRKLLKREPSNRGRRKGGRLGR